MTPSCKWTLPMAMVWRLYLSAPLYIRSGFLSWALPPTNICVICSLIVPAGRHVGQSICKFKTKQMIEFYLLSLTGSHMEPVSE